MDESPGWEAIDAALRRIYGDQEPAHYGTLLRWSLGGPDPLDGISAYPRTEPVPHWHFVSYGMTELYSKESDDLQESGWGFEFTFRLVRDPAETTPPAWALSFLQNLARYVYNSGNWFEPGHHMNVNGPIASERDDSEIRAIGFVPDPELGGISTPHGRVEFLQIVGLAAEEYEALQRWNAVALMELLAPRMPLYTTDLDRRSLLGDPEVAAAVQAGIERDGSTSGTLYVNKAHWERDGATTTLRIGALQAASVGQTLRGRLPFGRALVLQTDDTRLRFHPSDAPVIEQPDAAALSVGVPAEALDELVAALVPRASVTPLAAMPGVVVEIVPTAMLDRYGEETGEVVG
ncbi:suppressor of fused domain protein [Actinomadura xylanilytica]|uniref:suppressor of fused domain protein n=1 Tax=Actinomadura xylanilytica TaxID=887459 RepID=UPI00255AA975|nr:suppressor of fused domain protein [Actinomadura xylanilytica]MDL4773688.1 suppressor of fused domain protein [Actinomadura xylanilytica]